MRKFYQKKWHDIYFKDLPIQLSTENLPTKKFYNTFYKEFNKRYCSLNQINKGWLNYKIKIARIIKKIINMDFDQDILSIGSGLGIIEKKLFQLGIEEIYLQEISNSLLKFLGDFTNSNKVFIGKIPECIPNQKRFKIILLVDIDYCFEDLSLINFLKSLSKLLYENGYIIFISGSVYSGNFAFEIKSFLTNLLIKLKLINVGQFWGYSRTIKELKKVSESAGYHCSLDSNNFTENLKKSNCIFILRKNNI